MITKSFEEFIKEVLAYMAEQGMFDDLIEKYGLLTGE